jgi:uncharacterized protein (TIGR02145 family)
MKRLAYLSLFTLFCLTSGMICDDPSLKPDNSEQEVKDGEVKGKIVLPVGASLDVNTLFVINLFDEIKSDSGNYKIATDLEFRTSFVVNADNDIILMGYYYPGQTDFSINAKSTALAILMNMPMSFQLSEKGRTQLLDKILSDSVDFQKIVNATGNIIKQGKSPMDISRSNYMRQVSQYFEQVSTKQYSGNDERSKPVKIIRAGKLLEFQNNAKTYSTAVGIYRDEVEIKSIMIDRVKFVPESVKQFIAVLNGTFLPDGKGIKEGFAMDKDGEYEIRIRNGRRALIYDNSKENIKARLKNAKDVGIDFFDIITGVGLLDKIDGPCRSQLLFSFSNFVLELIDFPDSKDRVISVAWLYEIQVKWIELTKNGLECLGTKYEWQKMPNVLENFFRFYGVITSGLTTVNYAIGAYQWALDESQIDTCFSVKGINVGDCGGGGCEDSISVFTDPRDGQKYQVVKIGDQCWFAENLRYSGNIPEVKLHSIWSTTTQPAWCYYDNDLANDSKYGKLYNWYAVENGSLCAPGWHVPSDAEWTKLANYLGGGEVAGGKMKSVTGWRSPNIGATNSSGFSGLPGGVRNSSGVFDLLGFIGNWWSLSEGGSGSAWSRDLAYGNAILDRPSYGKRLGLSVRCIRD